MIFLEGANGRAFVANTLGNAVEHAWDALVDFGLTLVTGDVHDRKYAAGQLGAELFTAWATGEISAASRAAMTGIAGQVAGNEA